MSQNQNYHTQTGDGVQSLDTNGLARRLTNSIITGCAVSLDTGNVGDGNAALAVQTGEAIVEGAVQNVTAQSVDVPDPPAGTPDAYRRKDVVYLQPNGTAALQAGQPEDPEPPTEEGVDTERPAPPEMDDVSGAVLAEIWVRCGVSTIRQEDVTDRRMWAAAVFGDLEATETFTDPAGTEHTDELADASDIPDTSGYVTDTEFSDHTGAQDAHYTQSELVTEMENYANALAINITGDASTLDGNEPSAFAASNHDNTEHSKTFAIADENDTISGVWGIVAQADLTGTVAQGNGEALRIGGGTSDLVLSLQGGHGRFALAWNAYYDGTDWRYTTGSESASMIDIAAGGQPLALKVADGNAATAGDAVSWTTYQFDADGTPTFDGNPAVVGDSGYRIEKNGTDGQGIINFKTQ